MARIMTLCPSGRGAVPTGYRTADLDLTVKSHTRSFRCVCGVVHSWNEDAAWPEHDRAVAPDEPTIWSPPPGGPPG